MTDREWLPTALLDALLNETDHLNPPDHDAIWDARSAIIAYRSASVSAAPAVTEQTGEALRGERLLAKLCALRDDPSPKSMHPVDALRAEGAAAERARIVALLEGLLVRVGENSAAMGVAAALSAVRSASPSAAPSVGEDTP